MEFLLFDQDLDMNLLMNVAESFAEPLIMENAERVARSKNENYFEETVTNYSDDQFKFHFRMGRNTFEDLCKFIQQRIQEIKPSKIDIRKKVLLTIYLLSYNISFNDAGDKFNMSGSTAHYIFKQIINILSNPEVIKQIVKWPEEEHYNEIADVFCSRSRGFPGVIGIIDGCHINIKQPIGNSHDFYNRFQRNSIILQGVCDHTLKFIDIVVGMPGRMHDARVFRNSPLYSRILASAIPNNYHLLGDSANPLMACLLTPFKDNGHLDNFQLNYNNKLSSIRSTIERAFGLLKNKFRRLRELDIHEPEMANSIIAAACVLHNFLILHGEIEDNQENEYLQRNGYFNEQIVNPQEKRNLIAQLIV